MTAARPRKPALALDWHPGALPAGTEAENIPLRAADGAATGGALYRRGQPKTAVFLMHPREFFAFHYLVPQVVEAGYAAWAQLPRAVGNDARMEHEIALFDVAAGLTLLRERGFENVVFLGNSGGSGLFSLYVQQASLPPAARLAKTPGGRRTGLDALDMPLAQGMAYLAPHPGQGQVLLGCIDPSVVDEDDPLQADPALDPFNPANGYVPAPESSRYAPEFVARYRKAQLERVQRLDGKARALIARRQEARKRLEGSPEDWRAALHTPVMTVWRTDADLRCLDLSLDPSDRGYGSVWGRDLRASNYGAAGFARTCTPEAWLSNWSALSSNAALSKTAPAVTCPTLLVEYTGDQIGFPAVTRAIFDAIGAADKTHVAVRGDHYGKPLAAGEAPGRQAAGRAVTDWMKERFPT